MSPNQPRRGWRSGTGSGTSAGMTSPEFAERCQAGSPVRISLTRRRRRAFLKPGTWLFIIANANDLGDAQRQLGRLPFVALGFMTLDFTPVNEL